MKWYFVVALILHFLMKLNIFSCVYGSFEFPLLWSFHSFCFFLCQMVLFLYWFVGILYMFWISILGLYVLENLPDLFLLFTLWDLLVTEVCKFNVVKSITLFLLWFVLFVSYLRNLFLLWGHKDNSPVLVLESFTVCLSHSPLCHLDLMMWVGTQFILFTYDLWVVPSSFIGESMLSTKKRQEVRTVPVYCCVTGA